MLRSGTDLKHGRKEAALKLRNHSYTGLNNMDIVHVTDCQTQQNEEGLVL